jgi:KDO2-lipid IV(A) lauroyltransferase
MSWSKQFRYAIEYLLVRGLFGLFGFLSLDRASALGGWIGRTFGPRLAITKRARDNLARALPELSEDAREQVVHDMWDNLGRMLGEYPHLGEIRLYGDDSHVEVVGVEHIDRLREDGIGGIFFSGHIGNWEIASLGATRRGVELVHIYRAANNPWVEQLIQKIRAPIGGEHHAKSVRGARNMLVALKRGEHLGLLVDQKYNEGIAVPFFGRDAMTAPALAELALKFQVPVVPARVERLGGARFRLTISPPLDIPDTRDPKADIRATMVRVNALFEDWIRERPGEWLWLHRRWPKDQ